MDLRNRSPRSCSVVFPDQSDRSRRYRSHQWADRKEFLDGFSA